MAESLDDAARDRWLTAFDLARGVFPRPPRAPANQARRKETMYTLNKAKAEIDIVAKHAAEIAGHMLAMGEQLDAKLELLKGEILDAINTKFEDFARTVHGEAETQESSALADLGATVARLTKAPPTHHPEASEGEAPAPSADEYRTPEHEGAEGTPRHEGYSEHDHRPHHDERHG